MANTPNIRFAGYTDDWEQRKLGDTVSLRGRIGFRGYTQNDLVSNGEGAITFSPADIDDSGNVSLDNNKYLTWEKYEESPEIKVQVGDILFTKTASIGKVGYVRELKEKATINPQIALLTPVENTNGYFTFLSVKNEDFMKQVRGITGGSSVPTMSQEKLKDLTFMSPSLAEQENIGSYFANLDNLITLHQRKLDSLNQCKKYMLSKMFPKDGETVPEIRFDGFTGDWEQRKLSEIATMHARIGWQNLRTSEFLDSGDYLLITGTDFVDGVVDFSTCHYVERERYEQDKHIQIRNGSILITKDGTLGKVAYIQGLSMPATLNAGVFNVEIKDEKEVDNRYLFQYLKAPFLMDYVDKKATGGTIKHLNQNILVDFPVVLPHKAEQEKIGEYFLAIDRLITLHQRKLDSLKEFKKYMLQNMFPSEA